MEESDDFNLMQRLTDFVSCDWTVLVRICSIVIKKGNIGGFSLSSCMHNVTEKKHLLID